MDQKEAIRKRDNLIKEYGPWWDAFQLIPGVWTREDYSRPNPRIQKLLQIIKDLCPTPLTECRILDLGCGNGHFSLEFALHGADVFGIEGRSESVKRAEFAKELMGLENVSFETADVRNISAEKYGIFDIIVCSGLLYHLNSADIGPFLEKMYSMTRHMSIIDTHISLTSDVTMEFRDIKYYGTLFREHYSGENKDTKLQRERASLDNVLSFWPTRPSLINLLTNIGYSSTYECFTPPFFGTTDRVSFVAIKNQMEELKTFPGTYHLPNWSENDLYYSPKSSTRKRARWMLLTTLEKLGLLKILKRLRTVVGRRSSN